MYDGQFQLEALRTTPSPMLSEKGQVGCILALVQALIQVNKLFLYEHPDTPPLQYAGIVYRRQKPGDDRWWDIPQCLAQGSGSCNDLVAYRVADLQVRGNEPSAHAAVTSMGIVLPSGSPMTIHHVLVVRADGTVEDPSAALGMGDSPFCVEGQCCPGALCPPQAA